MATTERDDKVRRGAPLSSEEIRDYQHDPKRPKVDLVDERKSNIEKYFGYSNEDNPFGDPNLADQFVWEKKNKLLKAKGQSVELGEEQARKQQQEAYLEFEKFRIRGIERALEREHIEKQRASMVEPDEMFEDWKDKEENFLLDQLKIKSKIRIKQKRETYFDILMRVQLTLAGEIKLSVENENKVPLEYRQPYLIFTELSRGVYTGLLNQIQTVADLEGQKLAKQFWRAILLLGNQNLEDPKVLSLATAKKDPELAEILDVFEKKTLEDLADLEEKIRQIMGSPKFMIDTSFYDRVIKRLQIEAAKETLHKMFREFWRRRLTLPLYVKSGETQEGEDVMEGDQFYSIPKGIVEEQIEHGTAYVNANEDGSMTPPLITELEEEFEGLTMSEQEYKLNIRNFTEEILEKLREEYKGADYNFEPTFNKMAAPRSSCRFNLRSNTTVQDPMAERMLAQHKSMPMESDENTFNGDVKLHKHYDWELKYIPRKPKFFNRVRTAIEWNKYHQTHFDSDNPPPKVVQGYKFNVFYPDLIDKKTTPQYFLEESDTPGTVLIRFHAGPPYEDIAFKVVNREW
eukprot:CAMPEP_0115006934 /NCGR_PEP_ID=MMETSP0216-20121206/20821_1 /TAXON_ID=223996 /ORGANISM="Protocruzia adherens, Strain Boccale" /LENGTH=572 /DNA_ID=CAMNT_0002373663 /DNA_START=46 /DNA_END=1761 /DNA_ORIENTATION=-